MFSFKTKVYTEEFMSLSGPFFKGIPYFSFNFNSNSKVDGTVSDYLLQISLNKKTTMNANHDTI